MHGSFLHFIWPFDGSFLKAISKWSDGSAHAELDFAMKKNKKHGTFNFDSFDIAVLVIVTLAILECCHAMSHCLLLAIPLQSREVIHVKIGCSFECEEHGPCMHQKHPKMTNLG